MQSHDNNGPTSTTKYRTKNKLQRASACLPQDAKIHLVNSAPIKEEKVLLHLRRGGYKLLILDAHIFLSLKCASQASASVALLDYTVTPLGHYPTQTKHAIEGLKRILSLTPPKQIIIAGESAGAHLTLNILSQLLRPFKNLEQPSLNGGKLGGMCLISPFLSFDYAKDSYERNAGHDCLTLNAAEDLHENFKTEGMSHGVARRDPGLSPTGAGIRWWMDATLERIILV
jgi:acetyl esterase/lipase